MVRLLVVMLVAATLMGCGSGSKPAPGDEEAKNGEGGGAAVTPDENSEKNDRPLNDPVIADDPDSASPLPVGAPAPDSELKTIEGEPVMLSAALDGKKTVLVFYRGGWCPFCTAQLADLNEIRGDLADLGYQIIAIAPEGPAKVDETIADKDIDYTIYSDPLGDAIILFGLAFEVPFDDALKYADRGRKLAQSPATNQYLLPVPAVFLIDEGGTITYSHYDPNYRSRLSNEDLLAAAKGE